MIFCMVKRVRWRIYIKSSRGTVANVHDSLGLEPRGGVGETLEQPLLGLVKTII